MFGRGNKEELETLIKKGKWDKIHKKYLYGSKEEQLALAKACRCSTSDDCVNTLTNLLGFTNDRDVKIEALHSLSEVGSDHRVSQIQLLLNQIDESQDKELYDLVIDTLHKLRKKA